MQIEARNSTEDISMKRAVSQQSQATSVGGHVASNLTAPLCTQVQWHREPSTMNMYVEGDKISEERKNRNTILQSKDLE